jgi:hypothetical protein
MARLAVISFGALVLALAAIAGLDAFTALHPSQGRPAGAVGRQQSRAHTSAHASMTADCGRGLLGAK